MKKSIKILMAFGMLILVALSAQAQINDWTGKWNTTLVWNNTLGELNITKSGNSYTGIFPNGKLSGKYQHGDLVGTYTRTVNSFDRTGMGKMGEFRFVMFANKKSYEGYYKPEGKEEWQPDLWNGKRPTTPTLIEQIERKEIRKRGDVLKDYVKNNPIANWTGTWETDTSGRFKVWDTGTQYKNNTSLIRIEGRFFIKGSGDFIDVFDVDGYRSNSRAKVFQGSFIHGGRYGYFEFKFGSPTDDDFSGYLNYNKSLPTVKPVIYEKRVYVKGKRTSSAKPNMNTY